jgi:hypothetical protein
LRSRLSPSASALAASSSGASTINRYSSEGAFQDVYEKDGGIEAEARARIAQDDAYLSRDESN